LDLDGDLGASWQLAREGSKTERRSGGIWFFGRKEEERAVEEEPRRTSEMGTSKPFDHLNLKKNS
jgi:hypothetical protein